MQYLNPSQTWISFVTFECWSIPLNCVKLSSVYIPICNILQGPLQPSPEFITVQTKITLICWQNHPSCEDIHTQALKIPLSNVVCTSQPPAKLWVLACLLLLEGMKRRFVFISRFSIAAGLASSAVVVQFPVCMSVSCADVRVRMCLSVSAGGCTHIVWVRVCLSVCICAPMHMCTSVCVSPSLENAVSSWAEQLGGEQLSEPR